MTDEKPKYSVLAQTLAKAFGIEDNTWSWHARFHPSLHDHMHALGVAAANYNHLEFTMQALFWHLSGLEVTVAMHLFSDLNVNKRRLDTLKRFVEAKEKDPVVKDLLEHFIIGFDINAENRNFLMHGMTLDAENSSELILKKFARNDPTKTNYMHLTAANIRKIADEIYSFDRYGLEIYIWLSARSVGGKFLLANGKVIEPTLPEKPPKPDRISLSDHPIRSPVLPPPQPTEG
jgi:hypothetical protein